MGQKPSKITVGIVYLYGYVIFYRSYYGAFVLLEFLGTKYFDLVGYKEVMVLLYRIA